MSRFAEDDNRQLREDVRAVLRTPEGRRLLVAVMNIGRVYAPTGCRASTSELAYAAGYRDAAAELVASASAADPDAVILALHERTQLQISRRAQDRRDDTQRDKP